MVNRMYPLNVSLFPYIKGQNLSIIIKITKEIILSNKIYLLNFIFVLKKFVSILILEFYLH